MGGHTPTFTHQFPICSATGDFDSALKKGRLHGISKAGVDVIERFQPYQMKTKGSAKPPLLLLHKLSNRDKHHMLAICAMNAYFAWSFVGKNGRVIRSDSTTEPVRDGGVLAEMPADMIVDGEKTQLQAKMTINIGFNEPTLSPFEVVETLQVIREFIGKAMLPEFARFFDPLPDNLNLTSHGIATPKHPKGMLVLARTN